MADAAFRATYKNGAPRKETRHFPILNQRLPATSKREAEATKTAPAATIPETGIACRCETCRAANGTVTDAALIVLGGVIIPVVEFGITLDDEAALADLLDIGRAPEPGTLEAISTPVNLKLTGTGIGRLICKVFGFLVGLAKRV